MRKKTCDKCGLKDIIMFRVKIDLSKKWIFLCKKFTDYSKKITITTLMVALGRGYIKSNLLSKATLQGKQISYSKFFPQQSND